MKFSSLIKQARQSIQKENPCRDALLDFLQRFSEGKFWDRYKTVVIAQEPLSMQWQKHCPEAVFVKRDLMSREALKYFRLSSFERFFFLTAEYTQEGRVRFRARALSDSDSDSDSSESQRFRVIGIIAGHPDAKPGIKACNEMLEALQASDDALENALQAVKRRRGFNSTDKTAERHDMKQLLTVLPTQSGKTNLHAHRLS